MLGKIVVATLIFYLSFGGTRNGINNQNRFYYVSFGCCFDNDSIIVQKGNQVLYSSRISTESSTGTVVNHAYLIQSPGIEETISFYLPKKGKRFNVTLTPISINKFVYVSLYKDSLSAFVSEKWLRGL
jgi:hypothetical protein